MATPKWTQEQAIALECARECMTDLMGICSTGIAEEEAKPSPNLEKIASLEASLTQLAQERASLTITDHDRIAAIRIECGARIRAYRQPPHQQRA